MLARSGEDARGHLVGNGFAAGDQAVVRASGGNAVNHRIVESDAGCELRENSRRGGEVRVHELLDFVSVPTDIVKINHAQTLLRPRLQQRLQAARKQHHRRRLLGQTRFRDAHSNQLNHRALLRQEALVVACTGAAAGEGGGDVAHGDSGERAAAVDCVGFIAAGRRRGERVRVDCK